MAWVTVSEASRQLGVNTDTVRRRIRRGELGGRQEPRPQGFAWMVELPDLDSPCEDTVTTPLGAPSESLGTPSSHPDNAFTDLVEVLREQLQEKDRQIEAKDRQLSELHVLLQQGQAALPPARDGRPWWRRLWARA